MSAKGGGGAGTPNVHSAGQVILYGRIGSYQGGDGEPLVAFLPEEVLTAWQHDLDAVGNVSTIGQLRAVIPTLTVFECPYNPDEYGPDDGSPCPDDFPFSAADEGLYEGGEMPPMPGQLMLEWMPADVYEGIGDVVTTPLSGDRLDIAAADAPKIVRRLRAKGYTCRRDNHAFTLFDC